MRMSRTDKAGGEAVRTFVCIEVPASIKSRIEELQRGLRRTDIPISWVKPANIHLTIKFLGDVAASRRDRVRQAVERACQSIAGFDLTVAGAGCFPSPKKARVLWIGLTDLPDPLRRLHANIEAELASEGFAREGKRFAPHLTIGRVRDPLKAVRTVAELMAAGFDAETFHAAEVIVMQSELNPAGSIYTPQAVIRLARQ